MNRQSSTQSLDQWGRLALPGREDGGSTAPPYSADLVCPMSGQKHTIKVGGPRFELLELLPGGWRGECKARGGNGEMQPAQSRAFVGPHSFESGLW